MNSKDKKKQKQMKVDKELMNSINYLDESKYKSIKTNKSKKTEDEKTTSSISLSQSLKSALKSSNTEKLDWIISQNLKIDSTINSLTSDEIEIFTDFLLEKFSNQKTKLQAITWIEEIFKSGYSKISRDKLMDVKSVIQPHIMNYNIISETVTRFKFLEEIRSKVNQTEKSFEKSTKTKSLKNKETGKNETQKYKVNLIFNESDSEDEKTNKRLKQIKQKNQKELQKKIKNQEDEVNDEIEVEEDEDNEYDDVNFVDDEENEDEEEEGKEMMDIDED